MKKILSFALLLSLLFLLVACSSQESNVTSPSGEDEKIWNFSIVFNGPMNDSGWNEYAWRGLEAIKEKYGESVKITYAEKVDQADYEDTFYGYAKDGYDMICANGFEFSDAALRVADEFPEVYFGIINGLEYRDNVCGLEFDNVEFGFICGVAAGAQSLIDGNKIAFVGIEAIPSYRNFYEGLKFGVQMMNPNAETKEFYTGDWTDVTKATEMTNTAIGAGYNIVVPWGSGNVTHAMYKACEDHGIKFIQTTIQMEPEMYKDYIILNCEQSNEALILNGVESCINGTFPANGSYLGNLNNGINIINRWGESIDEETRDALDAIFDDLRAGKIELPAKVTS